MKSFSLKSRWIDARDEHYPSPQDKLKFDDKVEFPSGYSPPNFYNQLLIYSLEIFKQVSKFFFSFLLYFFFFEKKILAPFSFSFLPFFFFSSVRRTISPRKSTHRSVQIEFIPRHLHPIDVYPAIIEIFDRVFSRINIEDGQHPLASDIR